MATIRLGDLLVKAKVISEAQLQAALLEQKRYGGHLGKILVRLNALSEEMLVKALSKQMNLPSVDLAALPTIPGHVRAKVPLDVARELDVVPLQLRDEGKTLVVAMAEPQNLKTLDTLRSVTGLRVVAQLAGYQAIARAIERFYEADARVAEPDTPLRMQGNLGSTYHTLQPVGGGAPAPAPQVSAPRPPPGNGPSGQPAAGAAPSQSLRAVEEAQRKEVAALKAMVEILIEKGVFTREEYLAELNRR